MTRRYRVDWLIPDQVLALTHFVPDVSMEDFMGIQADSRQALANVQNPIYLLIDNRIITNNQLAPLSQMLEAMPHIKHPQLQHIIMIVPDILSQDAATIPDQMIEHITLTHVATLDEAYDYLKQVDANLDWSALDTEFFKA